MVIGLIWGVWIGFALTCAGTYLGEALCFVGFKYFFQRKANEIETKSIWYACIARLMRHGGLGMCVYLSLALGSLALPPPPRSPRSLSTARASTLTPPVPLPRSIIIVRFSAVPGHVVTAIQSTVGMSFWVYSLAMCVSLARSLSLSRRRAR